MKIIFNKSDLTQALVPAMGAVSTKNAMNSTEGVLIETEGNDQCVLSAYDLEKGIRLNVPATVEEGGSYIIKADKLNQIVRVLPEENITLEVDRRNVTKITCGRVNYELHAMRGEDFPNLPELTVEGGFTVTKGVLRMLINSTIHAVAQNDVRQQLNGEFFRISQNSITVVACDSNRLAIMEKTAELAGTDENTDYRFILPQKSLIELLKLISGDDEETVHIRPGRKHVIFRIGEIFFFSRLIDEEYIDYERFFPKNNHIEVRLSAVDFMRSLERAMIVTEEKNANQTRAKLRCTFTDGVVHLTSVSLSGSVSEEVAISKTGEDIEIGFNCRFLFDAVKACTVDEIKLSMSTPLMSMIIEPAAESDEKFRFLILPLRLKD